MIAGTATAPGVVPARDRGQRLDSGHMTGLAGGVILVAAFAGFAVLATALGIAAFRRAGARDAVHDTRQGLSLPHDFRPWPYSGRRRGRGGQGDPR